MSLPIGPIEKLLAELKPFGVPTEPWALESPTCAVQRRGQDALILTVRPEGPLLELYGCWTTECRDLATACLMLGITAEFRLGAAPDWTIQYSGGAGAPA